MSNKAYLICLRNPFESKPFLILKDKDGICIKRDVEGLIKYDVIVSYKFSDVIYRFREKEYKKLPAIIDLEIAKKLLIGRQRSDFRSGEEPWVLRKILGRYIGSEVLKVLNDFLQLKMKASEQGKILKDFAPSIMNGFSQAWEDIDNQLKSSLEAARFYEIENPIYNLFLESQLNGILVPQIKLKEKLQELSEERYSHLKKLELKYNFIEQRINFGMSWADIAEYCSDKNIQEDLDYDFWKYAEVYSEHNEFLRSLVTVHNASIDYNALLRYSLDSNNKIYSQFDVMGTVTGRILITNPGIQYLKKTSRDIFKSKEGYVFLYADFSQFEPGIVASFSKDPQLLKLYNSGDVYCQLSQLLFNNTENRKLTKIIFLAFIYGMTKERLAKFIADIAGVEASQKGLKFFDEFRILCDWKEEVCNKAKVDGYSSSFYGNRRYIENKGELSNKEKRWVPNQIVQGTASYIFKRCLLELNQHNIKLEFQIPMHDAILLEIHVDEENNVRQLIEKLFNGLFQEICPGIKTGISFEKFG